MLGLLTLLWVPAAASAGYAPGSPPELCAGQLFSDQIGTPGRDLLQAARRAERLWGMAGTDLLRGSPNRATCMFGGTGPDVLTLGTGGGAAYGEEDGDFITGSPLDDILRGGAGADTIDAGAGADDITGGTGRDAVFAGEGDDLVETDDGIPEIVDCGGGRDLIAADARDALIGCEDPVLAGPSMRRLTRPSLRPGADGRVRVPFRVPRTGSYHVVLLGSCGAAGAWIADLTRVARGRTLRIALKRPEAGWCEGVNRAAVVLEPPCPPRTHCAAAPPGQPVARVEFTP